MVGIGRTKIGGQWYDIIAWHDKKSDAQDHAKAQRRLGRYSKVRVATAMHGDRISGQSRRYYVCVKK